MQYFRRLVTTFGRFTRGVPERGSNPGKMIWWKSQIIPLLFVYNERQDMKKRLIAGLFGAAVLGGISAIPAEAACRAATHCYGTVTKTSYTIKAPATHRAARQPAKVSSLRTARVHAATTTTKKRVHVASVTRKRVHVASSTRKRVQVASSTRQRVHVTYGVAKSRSLARSNRMAAAIAVPPSNAAQGSVVSLIKAMAPAQGVPTWFALRIAHVESNYNPHMRGSHGEYGVFQMKCATAKDIGFRGNCAALLDARTNIQWGLRHLAIAIGKSDGNLRLAASKHNGGLGRRTMIASYVAKVF